MTESSELPHFLFDGWTLRPEHARDHQELDGWNVTTLCSAYLKYQLDRHEHHTQANLPLSAPSLVSICVKKILEELSSSNDLHAHVKRLAERSDHTILRPILEDPRTPYPVLHMLNALPQTSFSGRSGIRTLIDLDEAILASERYLHTKKPTLSSSSLVRLEDLTHILGSPDANGITTFRRKTPPKGGFECLDQKRKRTMQILGTDARWIETFRQVTKGCLNGLDWKNVFIAGGVVLNTLLFTSDPKDAEGNPAHKDVVECDIDLYLYGLTAEEANSKVEHVYDTWYRNTHGHPDPPQPADQIILKNSTTITFIPRYPARRVQIFLKIRPSPQDILLNVDLDACALGFDGERILMLPRCARSIETGYCVFTMDLIWGHHLSSRQETQETRVFKYADRGFGMRLLPSYVQSLEQNYADEVEQQFGNDRSGPTRMIKGEPGLKTLKRIARIGCIFAQRYCFNHRRQKISLAALDGIAMHHGMPGFRVSLGFFELFMRHCECWRMDAVGTAV